MTRNNATQTGNTSSKELEAFISNIFDFLEKKGTHTEEIAPNKYYISVVERITTLDLGYGNGKALIILNCESPLKLEEGRTGVTLIENEVEKCGYVMDDIEKYIRIRHKIAIERDKKGKIGYYARDIEIID